MFISFQGVVHGGGIRNLEFFITMLQGMSKLVSQVDNVELEKNIEEQEIREAIWGLQHGKVPIHNGLPFSFYSASWLILNFYLSSIYQLYIKQPNIKVTIYFNE